MLPASIKWLAAALLIAPGVADARDWRLISLTREAAMFIDADRMEADATPYPHGWVLVVMPPGRTRFVAMEAHLEFDCAGHRRHGLAGLGYDQAGAILTEAAVESVWNPVPPGTLFSRSEDALCGRYVLPARSYGSDLPISEGLDAMKALG